MRADDFDIKNTLGRKVEEAVCLYYQEHVDKRTHLPRVPVPGYDIVCPEVGNIEVKEDRLSVSTGMYAFEYKNYKGEPSGVMGTEAREFVLVDYARVVMGPTESFRYILRESTSKRPVKMGYKKEDGRQCEGWLIPIEEIIYSPFVTVKDRWFPHWRIINGKLY